MVPKTGSSLPKSYPMVSDRDLAKAVSSALRKELGGSRRATKTVMRWTNVSDRTARSWIGGETSPSGINLVLLASFCRPVLLAFLELSGHQRVSVSSNLIAVEEALIEALSSVKFLIENDVAE